MTTPYLVFRDPQGHLNRVPLAAEGVEIGRDSEVCLVHGSDPLLSRVHAQVRREGEDWVVLDRDSPNHTYLNDGEEPATRAVLHDRDVIRCASLWVQCRLSPPPSAPAPLPAPAKELEPVDRLRQELAGARKERDEAHQLLRQCGARLTAEQAVGAALREELARSKEQLEQARDRARRLDDERVAVGGQLATAQAENRQVAERLVREAARAEHAEAERDRLRQAGDVCQKEQAHLREVVKEQERLLDGMRAAEVEKEEALRALHAQERTLSDEERQIRAERDRLRDEAQALRMNLAKAREELQELRIRCSQMEQILSGERQEGEELTRLTTQVSAQKAEQEQLHDRLARLRQHIDVLMEETASMLLRLHEGALAIRGALGPVQEDVARRVADAADQMMEQIQDAQGQLRGLRRVLQ